MTDTEDAPKTSEDILSQQIDSALSVGLDLGFGPLLVVAVFTLVGGVYGEPLTEILLANAYTIGFIFVVLGRTELFTEHTTLAVLPVLDRQASVTKLDRLWELVYAGNIVGGIVFATVAIAIGPEFGIVDPHAFAEITKSFVSHDPTSSSAALS